MRFSQSVNGLFFQHFHFILFRILFGVERIGEWGGEILEHGPLENRSTGLSEATELRALLPKVEACRICEGFRAHLISNVMIFSLHPAFGPRSVREIQSTLAAVKRMQGRVVVDFGQLRDMPANVLESLDLVLRFARVGGVDVRCHSAVPRFRTMVEESRFRDLARFVDDY